MSNKEIEKQAEELIEKHTDYAEGITSTPEETGYHNDGNTLRINSIKAAIVSCEFADRILEKKIGEESSTLNQIKAYLEGLL